MKAGTELRSLPLKHSSATIGFECSEELEERPSKCNPDDRSSSEIQHSKFSPLPPSPASPQLGYEILPNKCFHRYQPPTPPKDLPAEFRKLEKEAEKMQKGLAR